MTIFDKLTLVACLAILSGYGVYYCLETLYNIYMGG